MGTVTKKESNLERCKAVLKLLNEVNRVRDDDVDDILQQYMDESVVPHAAD